MLSGFSAQRFAFHGYLPRPLPLLKKKLQALEKDSFQATQLWIEAPYRTAKMLEMALDTLNNKTSLCLAANLTADNELVLSMPIAVWKKQKLPELKKTPAVFLIANELHGQGIVK